MKAAYWQRGEALDYKNTTSQKIEENTVIPIQTRIGVTGTVIEPGETGSLHVTGIFEMKKTDTTEIVMGAAVYFDGEGITVTADGNTPAGYAAQTSAAKDTAIFVKLLG